MLRTVDPQVSQYAILNKICKEAWETIATSFKETVAEDDDSEVAGNATVVALPGEKIGAKVSANLREPSDDTGKAAARNARQDDWL